MKKLFAVLLAAVMLLCSVSALAEAKTVSIRLYVNEEQLQNVPSFTGVGEGQTPQIGAAAKLLNALGIDVIADSTSGQLSIVANDQEVASVGITYAEDKIIAGTTLLPDFLFTLDQESLQKLLLQVMPQIQNLQSLDMSAMGQAVMGYVLPFMSAVQGAVTPGEPEQVNVEVGDYTFDTKVPVNVDVKAIADAVKKLGTDLLNDASVQQILQIVAQGQTLDVDNAISQMEYSLAEDKLPTVQLDMYAISSQPEVRYLEGMVTGAGMDEPALGINALIPGNGDVTITCTMLQMDGQVVTIHVDQATQTLTVEMTANGIWAAVVAGPAQNEEGQAFAANIYYMVKDEPLAQIAVTVKDGGTVTLDLNPENKTEIPVAGLIDGSADPEVMQSLQTAAQTAVFSVLGKLMMAVPELSTLMQQTVGQ